MKHFYIKLLTSIIIFSILFAKTNAQITTIIGRHSYLGDGGNALNAGLFAPYSIAQDKEGNLYIATQKDNKIRKVTVSTGIITTIAGTGVSGYNGDGIVATTATLNFYNGLPGLAIDKNGNLYVGDYGNNRVRKINLSTNIITTIAGTGVGGYSGDGSAATGAKLNGPAGVVVDTAGNVYFADNNNSAIREIVAATGKIAAVAGNGTGNYTGDGGLATAATLNYPESFVFDKKGNLLIADEVNFVVRKVDATTKKITTVAGTGSYGFGGDGGQASAAKFKYLTGIAIDTAGNIYLCDQLNNRVRKIDAKTGVINTIAGTGISVYSGDGVAATTATVGQPSRLFTDIKGNVYIDDYYNNRIRKITASTGIISTIAGDGTDGFTGAPDALKAQINPQGVAIDPSGNYYIADGYYYDIRAVNIANSSYIFAGNPGPDPNFASKGYGGNGGLASSALMNAPLSVVTDAANNVYIADVFNNVVRKINYSNKNINNVAGNHTAGFSGDGAAATAAELSSPYGIAIDKKGDIYIADAGNNRIRKVDATTQNISTIAGTSTAGDSGDGGAATSAKFNFPYAVAVDTAGNVFVVDKGNKRVRKIAASTQKISTIFNNGHVLTGIATDTRGNIYVSDSTASTIVRISFDSYYSQVVAGSGTQGYSGDGGAAKSAKLNNPRGLYVNASNQIYVADAGNNVIRKIIMGALPVELVSFTARKNNSSVLLQWKTATETNNSYFSVERSGDGANWFDIATVSGYGNTNIIHHYSYTDLAPLQGDDYYRLKQVDADGHFTYSEVRKLTFSNISAVRVYPNPATTYITVEINSGTDDVCTAALYTLNGFLVKTAEQHVTKGINQINLHGLSTLAKGTYVVKVTSASNNINGSNLIIIN